MSDDDSRHTESSQEEEEEEEEYEGEPPGQPQGRGSTFVNVKGTGPTTVGDSTHYHGNARIVNNFIVKGEEAALKILTWATQGLQLPNSANQQSIAYTNPGSSLNNTLQITQGSEPTVTEPEVTQPGEDRNVTSAESTVVITEQETTYSTKEQTTVNSVEQVNPSEPATTRKTVSSERTESIVVVTEQETTYSTKEESRVNSVEQAQPSVLPEPATSLEGQNIPSEQGFPEVETLPEVSVGKPPVDNRDGSREEASTSEGASGPAAQPENENRDVEVYSAPVAVRDQSGIARPWWERAVMNQTAVNWGIDRWLAGFKTDAPDDEDLTGPMIMELIYRKEKFLSLGDLHRVGDVELKQSEDGIICLVVHAMAVGLSKTASTSVGKFVGPRIELCVSSASCTFVTFAYGSPERFEFVEVMIVDMAPIEVHSKKPHGVLGRLTESVLTTMPNSGYKNGWQQAFKKELIDIIIRESSRLNTPDPGLELRTKKYYYVPSTN